VQWFRRFFVRSGSSDQKTKYVFIFISSLYIADFVFSCQNNYKKLILRVEFFRKTGQYGCKKQKILSGFKIWRNISEKVPRKKVVTKPVFQETGFFVTV
jgi:hypothetical protein